MPIKKWKLIKLVWFSLVVIFFIWQWSTYQSRDVPDSTFESNNQVMVEQNVDRITFYAINAIYKNQIIFFQGGLTDPEAYAPLCRQIAEHGFTCHLIKMAWRMPQWDYRKITSLFDLQSGNYIIGGHSQGAKIAAQFVYENPNIMKGLFLLGTSHPRDFDLSSTAIPALKIYAEHDGLASVEEVKGNKNKLPTHSILKEIKGGNHSQFGYLGRLLTDDSPGIDLNSQQRITLEYLISFFQNVE